MNENTYKICITLNIKALNNMIPICKNCLNAYNNSHYSYVLCSVKDFKRQFDPSVSDSVDPFGSCGCFTRRSECLPKLNFDFSV